MDIITIIIFIAEVLMPSLPKAGQEINGLKKRTKTKPTEKYTTTPTPALNMKCLLRRKQINQMNTTGKPSEYAAQNVNERKSPSFDVKTKQ